MKFLNIPSNYNFLESLQRYIVSNFKNDLDRSSMAIFLPSRRAVNELKRIFLYNSKNSVILPNIKAIGDIDYDEIVSLNYDNIDKYIDLTKPTSNIKYKLMMIKKLTEEGLSIDQAINLSNDLEGFFLEVEQHELKLEDLNNIVDDEYSIHWQKVLKFLKNFGQKWKNYLEENNIISNNLHILSNIRCFEENFKQNQPEHPIIFAGIFTDIKATNNLIKTLSRYDNVYYFMKGYLPDTIAEEIDSNYYYNNLPFDLEDVENLTYDDLKVVENVDFINKAMDNYSLTYSWHNVKEKKLDIEYFECENIYEEIEKITIYILDYIAKNGLKNIAVIADQDYAHLIDLNFKKYNLPVNNTFGNKYTNNNFIKYFLLIIQCYLENFKKEYFIDLLNNERVSFGLDEEELKNNLFKLTKNVFSSSIADGDLEYYIKNADDELGLFLEKIKDYFSIFKEKCNIKTLLLKHLELTKNISKEFGDKDIEVVEYITKNLADNIEFYGDVDLETYYKLLNYILSQQSYSDNYSVYPAINIISRQEARLINYDLVFVFNMNDGVFPKNIPTDPWMSKSMRKKFGLPPKELEIGKSAYDFIQLLSQRQVVITRSKKIAGNISFESRFLQRLKTLLKCSNTILKTNRDVVETYKFANSQKNENKFYRERPKPNPPEIYRPKKIFATALTNLLKNPYDIYAKYILNLDKLDIFVENIPARIGTLIHNIFEDYEKGLIKKENIKDVVISRLNALNNDIITKLYSDKIEETFKNFLTLRHSCDKIIPEAVKFMNLSGLTIGAQIDRIEINGKNAIAIDYKTGNLPSKKSVLNLTELQLPVEALILEQNGYFVDATKYWYINYKNCVVTYITMERDFLEKTKTYLTTIVNYFKDKPYTATNKNQNSAYNHLSRIDEWLPAN